MGGLIFNPDTHQYTLEGRRIPSVTEIIKEVMPSAVPEMGGYMNEDALVRGKRVHALVESLLTGRPTHATPVEEKYAEQFRLWYATLSTGFTVEVVAVEEPVLGPAAYFAGTPDIVFKIQDVTWVIDVKTGDPEPWHAIQTAGYACAVRAIRRGCLYLRPDSYRFIEHENALDEATFLSFVNVYNFIHRRIA